MEINILGAGTLGRFIIDVVESNSQFKISGFFDDGYPGVRNICGYEIVGKVTDIDVHRVKNLIIGIGEPKYRKLIFEEKSTQGYKFPKLIHKSVILSKYCTIEEGVIIGPNSSVLSGSIIKKGTCILSHVNINQDVVIDPYCLIGAGVVIGNNAKIGEGCHIGLSNHIKLNQVLEPWIYYNNVFQ